MEKWRVLEGGGGGWSSTVELDICMARARGEQIISANFKAKGGSGREGIIYNCVSLIYPT